MNWKTYPPSKEEVALFPLVSAVLYLLTGQPCLTSFHSGFFYISKIEFLSR